MTPEENIIKLTQLEAQIDRLVSDAESEKGTRARVNSDFTKRLDTIDENQRKLERIIYMGLGGLAVLQFLLAMRG